MSLLKSWADIDQMVHTVNFRWSSKYCWIDKTFSDSFFSVSLNDYDAFKRNDLGKTIRIEDQKKISYFEIEHAGKKAGFYIKIEFPKWYQAIKRFLIHRNRYKLASFHELQLLRFYDKNNISVVIPVAWGERRILGIPVSGFIVQREVVGKEFKELVKNGSRLERINLIKAYGKLVAELHSKGIISSVVRVTDLICTSGDCKKWDAISLVIIDREKGSLEQEKFTFDKCVYSLSFILKRFYVFIGEPTIQEICYFLKTYLEHLAVPVKPDFRKLFYSINCQYQ